jgi:hypothetical protein
MREFKSIDVGCKMTNTFFTQKSVVSSLVSLDTRWTKLFQFFSSFLLSKLIGDIPTHLKQISTEIQLLI